MSDIPFCVDCKHSVQLVTPEGSDMYLCRQPDLTKLSPVTGNTAFAECAEERGTLGGCGPTGQKYEARA